MKPGTGPKLHKERMLERLAIFGVILQSCYIISQESKMGDEKREKLNGVRDVAGIVPREPFLDGDLEAIGGADFREICRFWDKIPNNFLNSLPLNSFSGKIFLYQRAKKARKAVEDLLKCPLVGFDTESRPAFRSGQYFHPSVVQVADGQAVHLFQLQFLGGLTVLKPLLESKFVEKVCVGVGEDVRRLQAMEAFEPQGFVEITTVTGKLGIIDKSLRKLCANLLRFRISKREQTSNWALQKLSESQLRYAATDAWVSREIYARSLKFFSFGFRAEKFSPKNGEE